MNVNTQNSLVHGAMDGQSLYASLGTKNTNVGQTNIVSSSIIPTGAQVAQNIENSIAELKEDTQQLQKMSEMVNGNKIQFSFNKELGSVIVSIVDSNTNKVVKEIPSEDMQKLKLRIRKAIGNIFDEVI